MACLIQHNWSWPRKRGAKHVQVCSTCGTERESKVQFEGPRYRRTQEGLTLSAAAPLERRKPSQAAAQVADLAPAV